MCRRMTCRSKLLATLLLALIFTWSKRIEAVPKLWFVPADQLRQGLGKLGRTKPTNYSGEKVLEAELTAERGSANFADAVVHVSTPGKYRVTYRLSIQQPPVGTHHDVRLLIVQDGVTSGEKVLASSPLRWANFPQDGTPLDVHVEFTVTDTTNERGRLRLLLAWSNHGDLATLRHHGVKLELINDRLTLEQLRVDKLIYRRGETGIARLRVRNFSAEEESGTVSFVLTRELADRTKFPPIPITVAAGAEKTVEMPFAIGTSEFGYQLTATLRSHDGEVQSVDDMFSVADDWWKVAIGAPTGVVAPANIGHANSTTIADALEKVRAGYANWIEMFFWAPDDWGDLTPEQEFWYSGQGAYYQRRESIKDLIRQAHNYGIKVITYGKGVAGGPAGWEIARKHPDWFKRNSQGQLFGNYDVYALENWNNEKLRKSGTFQPDWQWLFPDFHNPEPLDWGIDQIIKSAKQFGWDGVRFDGHFSVADIRLSAYNMQRMKERIWQELPHFVFGFNYGWAPEAQPGGVKNYELQTAMAGGGHWMAEGIKSWSYGQGLTYKNWQHYSQNELETAKQVQKLGGTYHLIYGLGNAEKQDLYKLIYGLIAGGHSVYGSHTEAPGCANWGKFMTRWSGFLWNQRLQRVVQPLDRITAKSKSPMVWEPLVQERIESTSRKFLVVHLVNPSLSDEIEKTVLPAPVENILVGVKHKNSERVQRVVLVRPEAEPYHTELKAKSGEAVTQVVVPKVSIWAMVIFELSGEFRLPKSAPTSPLYEAAETAPVEPTAKNEITLDPLIRGVQVQVKPNEILWETDAGFSGIPAQVVADPDATGGLAQRRDNRRRSNYFLGRTWLGPFAPGRYRISYRTKWMDQQPYRRQNVEFYITDTIGHGNYLARQFYVTPNYVMDSRAKLGEPNVYQYYPFEIELKEGGYINAAVIAGTEDEGDHALYLDHIKTEQLLRYSDKQVSEWNQTKKPVALRNPNGDAPERVLLVKGLYCDRYGIQKALRKTISTYTIPATYGELYHYDSVVLCNVDFTLTSYALRKLLIDYVEDGGRLVILGGIATLGQGNMKQTYLDDILPVILQGPYEIVASQQPLLLGPKADIPYSDRPAVFWRHKVSPRSDAIPLAYAGKNPVASRRKFGRGVVVVFAGTVLGEGTPENRPFWECSSWVLLLNQMVLR